MYRGSGLGSNPIAFITTILKHIILTDNTVTGKLRLHFSVFQYGVDCVIFLQEYCTGNVTILFHDSTAVVQLTVNQLVPGSIPGRGAKFWPVRIMVITADCLSAYGSSILPQVAKFCGCSPGRGLSLPS